MSSIAEYKTGENNSFSVSNTNSTFIESPLISLPTATKALSLFFCIIPFMNPLEITYSISVNREMRSLADASRAVWIKCGLRLSALGLSQTKMLKIFKTYQVNFHRVDFSGIDDPAPLWALCEKVTEITLDFNNDKLIDALIKNEQVFRTKWSALKSLRINERTSEKGTNFFVRGAYNGIFTQLERLVLPYEGSQEEQTLTFSQLDVDLLQKLPQLKSLSFYNRGNFALAYQINMLILANLPHLTALDSRGNIPFHEIGDDGVVPEECPLPAELKLRRFNLSCSLLGDRLTRLFLKEVKEKRFLHLESLNLMDNKILAAFRFNDLGGMNGVLPHLKTLFLGKGKNHDSKNQPANTITMKDLELFGLMAPNLRRLFFKGQIKSHGYIHILRFAEMIEKRHFKDIEELDLSENDLSDVENSLTHLPHLPNTLKKLHTLNVSSCQLGRQGIYFLANAAPSIRTLNVAKNNFSLVSFVQLAAADLFLQLSWLDLTNERNNEICSLDEEGFPAIEKKLPRLSVLRVTECTTFYGTSRVFTTMAPGLRSLQLTQCEQPLSRSGSCDLAFMERKLTNLDLSEVQLEHEMISQFIGELPNKVTMAGLLSLDLLGGPLPPSNAKLAFNVDKKCLAKLQHLAMNSTMDIAAIEAFIRMAPNLVSLHISPRKRNPHLPVQEPFSDQNRLSKHNFLSIVKLAYEGELQQLHTLNLCENAIKSGGLEALFTAHEPFFGTISDFFNRRRSSSSSKIEKPRIPFPQLQNLNLRDNMIKKKGIDLLHQALMEDRSPWLKWINIRNNEESSNKTWPKHIQVIE